MSAFTASRILQFDKASESGGGEKNVAVRSIDKPFPIWPLAGRARQAIKDDGERRGVKCAFEKKIN